MRVFLSLGSFAIIGVLTLTGCGLVQRPVPPPAAPEHYICSDFSVDETDIINRKPVKLEDQFGAMGAEVRLIKYLCAPAFKFHKRKYTPPKDFFGPHLACYELKRVDPDKAVGQRVRVTNQFEVKGLDGDIEKRRLLCVPSSKIEIVEDKEPEFDREKKIKKVEAALDHFICSDFAPDEKQFNRNRMGVWMGDQFGPFQGQIRAPNLLCAPAKKTFNKREKEPANGFGGTHLACYFFAPKPAVGLPVNVLVINQLDKVPQRGKPIERHMFCVPTEKKVL